MLVLPAPCLPLPAPPAEPGCWGAPGAPHGRGVTGISSLALPPPLLPELSCTWVCEVSAQTSAPKTEAGAQLKPESGRRPQGDVRAAKSSACPSGSRRVGGFAGRGGQVTACAPRGGRQEGGLEPEPPVMALEK